MAEKVDLNEVEINGTQYVKKSNANEQDIRGDIKIVILQRGWIMVGRFDRNGSDCKLSNASVIRVWGTTNGLGELAKKGKLGSTKLDKCYGVVQFDYLTVVATIDCDQKAWSEEL